MLWLGIGIVCSAALGVLALMATMGLMSEITGLRAELAAWTKLVKNPPPPSFLGERAPPLLVEQLEKRPVRTRQRVVAFVTPTCGPCEVLVENVALAIKSEQLSEDEVLFVVWAHRNAPWEEFARRLPSSYIVDVSGELARACELRGAPAMLLIDSTDFKALDYDQEGDIEWLVSQLQAPQTQVALL